MTPLYDKASLCGENHLGLAQDRIQNRLFLIFLKYMLLSGFMVPKGRLGLFIFATDRQHAKELFQEGN